jgi:hypothetical protein
MPAGKRKRLRDALLSYCALATMGMVGLLDGVIGWGKGVGGARWPTNEVDKKLLRAAAGAAAGTPPSSDLAAKMATATPAGAPRMVRSK